MSDNKIIELYPKNEDVVDIKDCPKELRRMWILVEFKGTDKERMLNGYDTELDALRIANRVSHNDWEVFEADVVFYEYMNVKIMSGYEEI